VAVGAATLQPDYTNHKMRCLKRGHKKVTVDMMIEGKRICLFRVLQAKIKLKRESAMLSCGASWYRRLPFENDQA
jgi:hypothetical protein